MPWVVNLIKGPTCNCYLRTAVQIKELPSLSRLKRARKVLARLRPLITAAQGALTPEEISDRMRTMANWPAPAPADAASEADAPPRIMS